MNISVDQARAFCTVVDTGGYSQAAQKVNKSHTTLVYLIKAMEDQCGFALFDRRSYRNRLSGQGRRVYSKCKEILAKFAELEGLCQELSGEWEPFFKIVFDGILPIEPLLEVYKTFKSEKIPTVVQTYADYLEDVENAFYVQQADVMVSVLPVENKELEAIYLPKIKIFLVAHRDHPIHSSQQRWHRQDMHTFNFLTVRGAVQKLGLNTSDFEESASFMLSDFSFKKEAILKKVGYGWLPEHLIGPELQAKTLLPVKWERKSVHEIQPIIYFYKKNIGHRTLSRTLELLKKF